MTAEPEFGAASDSHGLVWGYRFKPGGVAVPITCLDAAGILAQARDSVFLWLHFSLANAAAHRWLEQHLNLPSAFQSGLLESSPGTRIEQDDDMLIAVIHDVLFDFRFDASDVSTVSLCVGPRFMVSARPRPVRSLDKLRTEVKVGATFHSPADLLAHLLQDQANVLVDIVRQATMRVDGIEDNLLRNRISTSRAELSTLRRVLVRLQRVLAPEPSTLFRLLAKPPGWIGENDLQDLRQAAEELSGAVNDSAALGDRIRLLQEELAALMNEQSNRTLFLLTLATVAALPFAIVSGLLGMNVGGIPFAENRHGFTIVLLTVVVATVLAGYWLVRRQSR